MGRSKDPILSVRLPDDLETRLTKCAESLDLSKNDIARHAIRAAIAAIEANGFKITLPLEMAVKKAPVESPAQRVSATAAKLRTPSLNEMAERENRRSKK